MPILARYDLAERCAHRMKWQILWLNVAQKENYESLQYYHNALIDVVMGTRPGLDRKRVEEMIQRFWDSDN
jgi:hypothetical protein